jgi:hypothetical protein
MVVVRRHSHSLRTSKKNVHWKNGEIDQAIEEKASVEGSANPQATATCSSVLNAPRATCERKFRWRPQAHGIKLHK